MKYLLAIALSLGGAAPLALSAAGAPPAAAACEHTCQSAPDKVCVACLEEQYTAELEAIESDYEVQREQTEEQFAAFRDQREDALEMTHEALEMELEARSEELERLCEELERRHEQQCEALEAEFEAYEESLETRRDELSERVEEGDRGAAAELAALERELEQMQVQRERRQQQAERSYERERASVENQLAVQQRELERVTERERAQFERDLATWERDYAKKMEAAERDAERRRTSLERNLAREAARAERTARAHGNVFERRAHGAAEAEEAERLARVAWGTAGSACAAETACTDRTDCEAETDCTDETDCAAEANEDDCCKSKCETRVRSGGVARVTSPRAVATVSPRDGKLRTFGAGTAFVGPQPGKGLAWSVGTGGGSNAGLPYLFRLNEDGKDVRVIGPDGAQGEITYEELGQLGSGTYAVQSDGGVVRLKALGQGGHGVPTDTATEGQCGKQKAKAKSEVKALSVGKRGGLLGAGDFAIRIEGDEHGKLTIIGPDGVTGGVEIDDLSEYEPGVYVIDTADGQAELVPIEEAHGRHALHLGHGVHFVGPEDLDFDVAFLGDLAEEMQDLVDDFELEFEGFDDLPDLQPFGVAGPDASGHPAHGELHGELGELSELLREMRAEMHELRDAVRTLRDEVRSLDSVR